MNLGTWNVQSIRDKTEEIEKELERLNIDIATLTETKKKGNGVETLNNYVHIFSGVPKESRASRGVSILISKKLKQKITNWAAHNENILSVNMNILGHKIKIFSVYSP